MNNYSSQFWISGDIYKRQADLVGLSTAFHRAEGRPQFAEKYVR
jgi:hypothetical protein